MTVAVIGLGRAGLAAAAALAESGRRVVGVEADSRSRAAIAAGRSPFPEPGLDAVLRRARARGLLAVSGRLEDARLAAVAFVFVGTPPGRGGELDASGVARVCAGLARLPAPRGGRVIAVRSTLSPGTTRRRLAPRLPRAARRLLCVVPEFTREGRALADARRPERLVVGAASPTAARRVARALGSRARTTIVVDWTTAETIKCADNAFHALKAAFANEVAALCEALGADAEAAMAALRADRRLNASGAYLRPGTAFGGPCLEKDLRALSRAGARAGATADLLAGVLASNARRLSALAARARRAARGGPVALLGLEFKRGTGDLRGSAMLTLARVLRARGVRVRLWDAAMPPGSAGLPGEAFASAREAARGCRAAVLGPGAGAAARRAARGKAVLEFR